MSKKSKTARAVKRKSEKRARKEQMKARYKAYAESGQNHKSKRNKLKKTRRGVKVSRHEVADCGNVGCVKCSGVARLKLWDKRIQAA